METKICTKCGEDKPLSDYYKDKRARDGLYPHCKACHYKLTHAYEQSEQGKEIVKKSKHAYYYERGGKEKAREYGAQESARLKRAEYAKSLSGKKAQEKKDEKRRDSKPNQLRAKTAVNNAIKKGILPRVSTLFCAHCGQPAVEYHHESYLPEHWLTVIPLCKLCHAKTYTTPY